MTEDFIWHTYTHTIPAAYALLPGRMNSQEATAQLLAIALQESGLEHRIQVPNGPAHGLYQFERAGGVTEVLNNPLTMEIAGAICKLLLYAPAPSSVYDAIVDNDVLATVFARLLLWIDPRSMPTSTEYNKGWMIYRARWRPGKPRPDAWPNNFNQAWRTIRGA